MSLVNLERFMVLSNKHVSNINRTLKEIKSDIMADFIWADNRRLIITTNKVTATSDLNTIENYIKNSNVINLDKVMFSRLLQFKSYLKIFGIFYFTEDTNVSIISDVVKKVLQSTYIFNNVIFTSQLHIHIIKASFKSDMAVI